MTTARQDSISTARTSSLICPYCNTPNLACDHYVGPDGNEYLFEMSLGEAAASFDEYQRSTAA